MHPRSRTHVPSARAQDETALICISTIKDGDNFYSKLLNLKDASTGKDFFKKHTFVLGCAACRAAGKASECHHMKGELPAWQSARKHKRIRAMMSDQKELMEQETHVPASCLAFFSARRSALTSPRMRLCGHRMGIMQNKNKRAFAPELCDRLMNADPFVSMGAPQHIFIAIDPNGGGDSDFAMCSAYYDRGTMIICGLESVRGHAAASTQSRPRRDHRVPLASIVAVLGGPSW